MTIDLTPTVHKLAFSIADAAVASSYSESTINLAITKGELRRVYANSKPVIVVTDLQAWLDSLPEKPPATPPRKPRK